MISGMISKLYVDFNSKVTQGQVIAEIDPKLFQGAVQQAPVPPAAAAGQHCAGNTSASVVGADVGVAARRLSGGGGRGHRAQRQQRQPEGRQQEAGAARA